MKPSETAPNCLNHKCTLNEGVYHNNVPYKEGPAQSDTNFEGPSIPSLQQAIFQTGQPRGTKVNSLLGGAAVIVKSTILAGNLPTKEKNGDVSGR